MCKADGSESPSWRRRRHEGLSRCHVDRAHNAPDKVIARQDYRIIVSLTSIIESLHWRRKSESILLRRHALDQTHDCSE